ncbi:hypothetical protein GGR32_001848 [Mesonia hippocampi]|uniref:Uncharacterized protein n=1 Tax=Mesonia hippocampi TaxID=1628250 RepID=A0A840EVK4_9FLAO|nr:hypothetical protein [Mesonia hippocampi]
MKLSKLYNGFIKKLKFLPQEIYIPAYYKYYTNKDLNLKNPQEFNEKIQWLKTYFHPPILNQLVDKYEVRAYVKKTIGEEYLNDLIGLYNKPSDINFDKLPNQFVIKGVHGCGFNIIAPDKSKLNKTKAKLLLNKWYRKNQYYRGGLEWAYKDVKPRFIVEKFLSELTNESLRDYKFFCFNGKAKFVEVHIDRQENHQSSFFDMDFNKLPFRDVPLEKTIQKPINPPRNFKLMQQLAEKLAANFPFVRVDLYSIKNTIIFGELTFYPADGRSEFIPNEYNKIIGEYITLPNIPQGASVINHFDLEI